jgi:hypothetical protein
MRFTHLTETVFNYLFGRFLRRAMLAAIIGLFAIIAIYHFTFAGILALENQYGLLYARLIVAGVYSVGVLILTIVFWAMRTKPIIETAQVARAITAPRHTQIAMLIEAVVLGYTLGRKSANRIR